MVLAVFQGVRFDDADALASTGASASREFKSDLLARPERTREGWLRAQGILTKPGVFDYRQIDGSIRREFRPLEEVFAPESIESFALVPLTLDHPRKLLDAETARAYAVGSVGKPERISTPSGEMLRADVLITDDTAIRAAENGHSQLSCGYTQLIINRAGIYLDPVTGKEERFDAIQTQIRGNHLALTNNARAGEEAHLRMDKAEARKDSTSMRIKMGGTEFDVPDALIALLTPEQKQSLGIEVVTADAEDDEDDDKEKDKERMDSKALEDLKKQNAALEGKIAALEADAVTAKKKAEEQARMDASSTEVTERVRLIASATPFIGKSKERPEGKTFDEMARMDSTQIMAAVVAAETKIDVKGKSGDFVRGVYEHVVASRTDTAAEIATLIVEGQELQVRKDKKDEAEEDPAEKARLRQLDRMKNAWKTEPAAGAK